MHSRPAALCKLLRIAFAAYTGWKKANFLRVHVCVTELKELVNRSENPTLGATFPAPNVHISIRAWHTLWTRDFLVLRGCERNHFAVVSSRASNRTLT